MRPAPEMRERLRALVPPPSRRIADESPVVPAELSALAGAASRAHRSVLAFGAPLSALTAVSAGVLRAARQRRTAVLLHVDLSETQGRGYAAALDGMSRAAEVAGYEWPLGLAVQVGVTADRLQSGGVGRDIGEALAAGFPTVLLSVELPVESAGLLEALAAVKELQLGVALQLRGGVEPEGFIADLRAAGVSFAALRGDSELTLVAEAYRWAKSEPGLRDALLEECPPLLEVDLALPSDARRERAEALAYYAAEAAIVEWRAGGSALALAEAMVQRTI